MAKASRTNVWKREVMTSFAHWLMTRYSLVTPVEWDGSFMEVTKRPQELVDEYLEERGDS